MEAIFPFEDLQILYRVAIATLLGGVIGFEREWSRKPAGLRTHMFVGGAAALLMSLGIAIVHDVAAAGRASNLINADPVRVVEAIVTGISFLGAGTILYRAPEDKVAGLTTAASLLFTSGVGIATALGKYALAVGLALLALAILRLFLLPERVKG